MFRQLLGIGLSSLAVFLCFACQPSAEEIAPIASPTATATLSHEVIVADPISLAFTTAVVGAVVDGDTIDVRIDGQVIRVRFIGVDTPEVFGAMDCFGREGSNFTKGQLTPGLAIKLEKDVSETDRFGRLLRYVYLPDGRMYNEVLVHDGYAQVATFPPDVKYQQWFLDAQRDARTANRGLWAACGSSHSAPLNQSGVSPTQSNNCDVSYPTVCIPEYAPDLDCGQITYKRFAVRQPDPHRFDADGDGIGCEN